jgi:hypothetical protein
MAALEPLKKMEKNKDTDSLLHEKPSVPSSNL